MIQEFPLNANRRVASLQSPFIYPEHNSSFTLDTHSQLGCRSSTTLIVKMDALLFLNSVLFQHFSAVNVNQAKKYKCYLCLRSAESTENTVLYLLRLAYKVLLQKSAANINTYEFHNDLCCNHDCFPV